LAFVCITLIGASIGLEQVVIHYSFSFEPFQEIMGDIELECQFHWKVPSFNVLGNVVT
jgi:hypothetical protein